MKRNEKGAPSEPEMWAEEDCCDCDDGWIVANCFEDTCCCADPAEEHGLIPCPNCNPKGKL